MSPKWRLNPDFWTQKKCPFPLNRGVPSTEVTDTKEIMWAFYIFQDQILCLLSQRRGSTVVNNHQFLKKSKNQPLTFFMGNLPIRMKNYVSTCKLKFETYFRILPALRTSYNVIRSLFLHQLFQACFTVSVQTWQNLWFLKLFHTNSTSQAFSNFF